MRLEGGSVIDVAAGSTAEGIRSVADVAGRAAILNGQRAVGAQAHRGNV